MLFATVLVSSSSLWAPVPPPPPQTTVHIYNHTDSTQNLKLQTRVGTHGMAVLAEHVMHFTILHDYYQGRYDVSVRTHPRV